MAKLTLNDITSGYSGPQRINANSRLIETALENTLSRDGTSPNQMEADFDMNGNRILNVASPQSPLDVARLIDITGLIELTGMPIPAVLGNDGKLLFTDGTNLYWGDIQADALPLFTSTERGAVPNSPSMDATKILWGNGTWATPASGNIAMLNVANVFTRAQRIQFNTVGYGATSTVDTSLGNFHKLTLTGNSTLAFSNAVNGTSFFLYITQDGTGSRTVSWPTVTWVNGVAPTLKTAPGALDVVSLRYDGTTWFGDYNESTTGGGDDGDYDLSLNRNEDNVDLFRRLGSPLDAQTWEVLIDSGVVISSRTRGVPALDLGGAFPSGTVINITNRGYVIGKGGKGAKSAALSASGAVDFALGYGPGQAGGDAIKGPATGVTVNFANASGRVWGGGGGGGGGGASSNDSISAGGAGGGGAGCGEGGEGIHMKQNGDTNTASTANAADGVLGLDGSDAGGAGAAGDGSNSGSNAADGGDGGDYGEAGENGAAASDVGLIIAPSNGGSAGRAVASGYAGTLNFTSGGSSPNVKGSV